MLKAGCSQMEITPQGRHYLRGYAHRGALSKSVEEKICAGVIVLEQEQTKALLITCDLLGISIQDCIRLRQEICQAYPCFQFQEIFLSASHTHFAPGLSHCMIYSPNGELPTGLHDEQDSYYSFFVEQLLKGVKNALDDLEEIRLLEADLDVSSVAFNRRTVKKSDGKVITNYFYPEDPENYDFSPIDTTFHVWKFLRKSDDTPKAVLARYGCHPVTGGKDPYGISGEYVEFFRDAIRREMGCEAFFMLGTAGDVVPLVRQRSARRWIGETLSNAVMLGEWCFRESPDFALQSSITDCDGMLPFMEGKAPGELEKEMEEILQAVRRKEYQGNFYVKGMQYEALLKYGLTTHTPLPVHLFRLGSHVLVGLPFEVLTDVGEAIRAKFPSAVIVSICGGYEGYLPLKQDFPKGGYETDEGTVFAEDTGDRLVEHALTQLEKFSQRAK